MNFCSMPKALRRALGGILVGLALALPATAAAQSPADPTTPPTTPPSSRPAAQTQPKSTPVPPEGGKSNEKPQRSEELSARQLLDKVVEVSGGDKLLALESLRWETVSSRLTPGGLAESTVIGRVRFPDRMRIESLQRDPNTRADVTTIFSLNGSTGWQHNGTQVSDVALDQVQQTRDNLLNATTALLQVAAKLQVKKLDRSIMGAKDYHRIEVRRDQLSPVVFWVHPDDFTIRRRVSTVMRRGKPVQHEEMLWDYRPVEGLLLPYSRKIFDDGQETALFSINRYVVNEKYDDDLFGKPKP